MSGAITAGKNLFLDPFALRQWDDPEYKGTRIDFNKTKFLERIEEAFASGEVEFKDGYAPFCKHIFVENFVGARAGAAKITPENEHLLRSGYSKRRPEELAVLTRWFSKEDVDPPLAKYLDVILYSRDQIVEESNTISGGSHYEVPDIPWGIISVKAQMEGFETPMTPITIMRNALGTEQGGSGVPIDIDVYNASVSYWQSHALIA